MPDQELTPAERFAASKKRSTPKNSALTEYTERLPFSLDDFQIQACKVLERGNGVLVAAPTGAGKLSLVILQLFLLKERKTNLLHHTN